jgi:prolyl 4-hydroxylase
MSRSSDSRNPSSSSTSSFSIATLVQYCFLAIFGYVLAGAPLQNLFAPSTSPSPSERAARRAQWRNSIKGVQIAKEKLDNLVVPDRNLSCALHQFKGVHVMSREPLVVYIEGFLSEGEVGNLVDIRYALLSTIRPKFLLLTPHHSLTTHTPS